MIENAKVIYYGFLAPIIAVVLSELYWMGGIDYANRTLKHIEKYKASWFSYD